jgi:hypothetical protein
VLPPKPVYQALFSKVLVKEMSDLFERLPGLGRANVRHILRVRLAFIDLKHRFDTGLAQFAMDTHIARPRLQCPWTRDRNARAI